MTGGIVVLCAVWVAVADTEFVGVPQAIIPTDGFSLHFQDMFTIKLI